MLIIAPLMALMSACAPVTVPMADGYDLVAEVPLAYDDDLDLWTGATDDGCDDDVLLTADCEETGQVSPDALVWLLEPDDECMVGVDASPDDGPCVAWTWVATAEGARPR